MVYLFKLQDTHQTSIGTLEIIQKNQHAQSRIPEIEITSTSSKWSTFTTIIDLFTRPKKLVYSSNISENDIESDDPDDSNSKVPVNPNTTLNIPDTAPDSSASIIPEFFDGDNFIYCHDGYEKTATLQTITYSDNIFNYLIKLPNKIVITTTKTVKAN